MLLLLWLLLWLWLWLLLWLWLWLSLSLLLLFQKLRELGGVIFEHSLNQQRTSKYHGKSTNPPNFSPTYPPQKQGFDKATLRETQWLISS